MVIFMIYISLIYCFVPIDSNNFEEGEDGKN